MNTGALIMEVDYDKNTVFELAYPTIYYTYRARKSDWDFTINLIKGDSNLDDIVDIIDINDKDELQKNIKSNDISFVFPHQLKTIDKKFFNFVLAIDCIHEMDNKTIKYYFDLIYPFVLLLVYTYLW